MTSYPDTRRPAEAPTVRASGFLPVLGVALALGLLLGACDGDGTGPGTTHDPVIDILPDEIEVPVGSGVALQAEATDSTGAAVPASALTWTSIDHNVAEVDSTGTVWAVGVGTTRVMARLGGPDGPRDSARVVAVAPSPVEAAHVVTGRLHSCALDAGGRAWCWGEDSVGQLGNGTLPNEPMHWSVPVRVAGDLRFTALSAGVYHTCGVGPAGAHCWGGNAAGQLGTGDTEDRTEPVAVGAGIAFTELSAGDEHTCGLDDDGRAYCWGRGVRGQLGTGAAQDALTPQPVDTDLRFRSLAGGGWHSCGLDDAGAAYCWGQWRYYVSNYSPESLVPVRVMEDATFRHLDAAQLTTCGLRGDGSVQCLGHFWDHMPVVPADLPPLASLSAGYGAICGTTADGEGYCWGRNNHGQLGDGTTTGTATHDEQGTRHARYARVEGGFRWAQLAPGWGTGWGGQASHTCGLTEEGQVYCWGLGGQGQIGNGILDHATTPLPVTGAPALVTVSASRDHACGLTAAGEAWCWGSGGHGQLGSGTTPGASGPVPVQGGLRFTDIAAALAFTCGVTADGSAYCWGLNRHGQLADGTLTSRAVPSPVTGGLQFQEIEGGSTFVCARSGTDAFCWGAGHWRDPAPSTPTRVAAPAQLASVAAGCGLTAAGKAYCWDGGSTATAVPGDLTFTTLDVGGRFTCGLDDDGRAHCWGVGTRGELGTGGIQERVERPVEVLGDFTFERISAGYYHACGVTTDGELLCWGANEEGQLGDGSRYTRPAPVEVTPPGVTVRDVSAGEVHTCGVDAAGGLWCWGGRGRGDRGWGLLGDGVQWRTTPVPVGPPLSP